MRMSSERQDALDFLGADSCCAICLTSSDTSSGSSLTCTCDWRNTRGMMTTVSII
jgi:hypothetical protein